MMHGSIHPGSEALRAHMVLQIDFTLVAMSTLSLYSVYT